jgi:peptidoglycan lytic transglycosylase
MVEITMRSLLAAVVAALAVAGGAALPAEAFTGADLRATGSIDRGVRAHEGTDTPRPQPARAVTGYGDDEVKPTHRWRREGRLERRYAKPRHARSTTPALTRAHKHAGKQRRASRRPDHKTARHVVRSTPRAAARWIPAGDGTTGVASFYGGQFHGRRTASGVRFDANGLTAAHRSLPFGTRVRVTHLGNGRTVDVRINDRGPFVGGRIIDLSRGAAGVIGMHQQGVARVKVTVLGR